MERGLEVPYIDQCICHVLSRDCSIFYSFIEEARYRLEEIAKDIKKRIGDRKLKVVTLGNSGPRDWSTYKLFFNDIPYDEVNLDKDVYGDGEYRLIRTDPETLKIEDGSYLVVVDKSIKTGRTMAGGLVYLLENSDPAVVWTFVTSDWIGMANYSLIPYHRNQRLPERGTRSVMESRFPEAFSRILEKTQKLSDDIFDPPFEFTRLCR